MTLTHIILLIVAIPCVMIIVLIIRLINLRNIILDEGKKIDMFIAIQKDHIPNIISTIKLLIGEGHELSELVDLVRQYKRLSNVGTNFNAIIADLIDELFARINCRYPELNEDNDLVRLRKQWQHTQTCLQEAQLHRAIITENYNAVKRRIY